MRIRVGNPAGFLLAIVIVFGPGAIIAFVIDEASWAVILPVVTIGILLGIAALPIGRKISPAEYADELEHHLHGTENDDEWDRTASVRLRNPRLEQLRRSLPDSFDNFDTDKDREILRRIIEMLREGMIPDSASMLNVSEANHAVKAERAMGEQR